MKPATVTRNFVKCLLAAFLAVACTAEAVFNEQAPVNTEPVSPFVGPTATVEFDEDLTALLEESAVKSADARDLLEGMGIKSLRRVFPDAGEYEARSRAMGMHRFYWVELAGVIPETKAAESLEASPGVLSVTLPRPIRRRGFFNDPYLARQWNMVNTNYPAADIHLEEVWRDYTVGNNKVIVCVVDEPVDYTHPDLIDNIWSDEEGHHGYSFVWNSYDLSLYSGDYGHATHVGGVISAMNNNGLGVSGMAGGDALRGIPGVLLQSAAIFSGYRSANEAAAIKWGADHGAVISQNSWGYYADNDNDGRVTDDEMAEFKGMSIPPAVKKAIDYFIRYAGCDSEGNQLKDAPMKGGLVIFSAGNEGDMGVDYDPICDYEPVISVGAFGIDGKAADYSNFGNWVDIAAPGGGATRREDSIWSTVPLEKSDNIGYQNIDSDGYYWVGTSMACPHVSGLAALIISYFGREGFTADQCREILFAGLGDIIGGSKPVGRKMDALASFEYGVQHYPAGGVDPLPPSIELERNNITVKAHEQVSVQVRVSDPNRSRVFVNCTPGSDAFTFNPETNEALIIGRNAPAGTYTAVFTAKNAYNLTAEATLQYTILPNHAPVLASAQEDLVLNAPLTISPAFRDEDGETLTLQATSADPAILQVSASGSSQIQLTPVGSGLTTVTVTASDALGASASFSFRVAVRTSSKQIDVYPVPASTVVYFWPASIQEQPIKVTLYSATGSRVKSAEFSAGVFQPAKLDITSLAPGKYTAVLEYDGTSWRETVVKI